MAISFVTLDSSTSLEGLAAHLDTYAATVAYSTDQSKLGQQAQGVTKTYVAGDWKGLLHTVVLTGLKPQTVYYYRAQVSSSMSSSTSSSAVFSFRSSALPSHSPSAAAPLVVAAFADLGEECKNNNPHLHGVPGCGNATIDALSKAATAGDIHLMVHAGDIAYTRGDQAIWDEYMREMEPSAARVPYMVCPGNHEKAYDFAGYRHRFHMPSGAPHTTDESKGTNNLWHTFQYGSVHFVSISTEHDYSVGSEQYTFVEAALASAAASPSKEWLLVFGHRPLYCSANDHYDCDIGGPTKLRPVLEPLFKKYGVDAYLTGHVHNYERTTPVYDGHVVPQQLGKLPQQSKQHQQLPPLSSSTPQQWTNPNATVHAVIGMAGCDEGLTDTWNSTTPAWSAFRSAKLGWARLTFSRLSSAASVKSDGESLGSAAAAAAAASSSSSSSLVAEQMSMKFEYVLSNTGAVEDAFEILKTPPAANA
jgi:hypothetical protein